VGGGVDDDMVVDKLELEKEDAECVVDDTIYG